VVVWADAVGFLAGAALLATFFFVSLHLQQTLHWSPLKAALGYIPLMGSLFAGAGVASALLSRIGQRRLIRAGMVAAATGLLILSRGVRVAPDPYVTALLPGFVVMGTGLGLILVALTTAAIPGGDERSDGGVASGLYNTALQIGGAVGIAVLATVARARTSALTRSGVGPTVALTRGRSTALVVAAVILAAGMVLAFGLPARVPDE
jgi:fucose permease